MKSVRLIAIPIFTIMLTSSALIAQSLLPVGSNPPAITFKYFPNKVYAVIWRNWNLVTPARIAMTIGCNAEDVRKIATSMGLPPEIPIPNNYHEQMFETILRRNWQLLPYNQLLTLLNISAKHLSVALREDDFLFIKLGSLKPKCTKVFYSPPNGVTKERAKQIKHLVEKYFKDALKKPAQLRFSFVKELSSTKGFPIGVRHYTNQVRGLRFIYSYFGLFGDPLIDTSLDPYPDGLLARYASEGVNGVWLPVVLNKMAPGGKIFPEFGVDHRKRITNLRSIVERAKKYGISVYLYLNEPRAMPSSFFEKRQDMGGVREGNLVSMCTSNKEVKDWMRNSLTYIFQQVPDLGGIFTITASENLTNCVSHSNWNACPVCGKRSYADIIAGVNKIIAEGVHRGNPDAKVIVWDWGWDDAYTPEIIAKLPKSVWFMSVSEWAKPFERGGVKSRVGEYSMSVVGPGPRATRNWALAKAAGLKIVAKVQFNNTWELSAVPWLPVLNLVAQHAENLAKIGINGTMLSWSLGGYPSPNLEIAQAFFQNPDTTVESVLNSMAIQRYGKIACPYARKTWLAFSNAFKQFPYSAGVLYKTPLQLGPANLLHAKPTGYAATMVGFPYDDLNSWRSIYPKNIFASQFDKVVQGWETGLNIFKKVVQLSDPQKRKAAINDFRIAKAAYLHFASVSNQIHFVIYRDSLLDKDILESKRKILKKHIQAIINNEIKLAVELFEITREDSRIGFEASNQYYYVPQDLMEKVIDCKYVEKMMAIPY